MKITTKATLCYIRLISRTREKREGREKRKRTKKEVSAERVPGEEAINLVKKTIEKVVPHPHPTIEARGDTSFQKQLSKLLS